MVVWSRAEAVCEISRATEKLPFKSNGSKSRLSFRAGKSQFPTSDVQRTAEVPGLPLNKRLTCVVHFSEVLKLRTGQFKLAGPDEVLGSSLLENIGPLGFNLYR